jgi:hypothetical protein
MISLSLILAVLITFFIGAVCGVAVVFYFLRRGIHAPGGEKIIREYLEKHFPSTEGKG